MYIIHYCLKLITKAKFEANQLKKKLKRNREKLFLNHIYTEFEKWT